MAAQNDENASILIVHPAGQDVTLSYHLRLPSSDEIPGWMIDQISNGVSSIANGILGGRYSADQFSNDLIIKNITMNDDRNDTRYKCVILRLDDFRDEVVEYGNVTILYVAGEYLIFYVSIVQVT